MKYERLTTHSAKGLKLRKGKKYMELLEDKELTKKALYRLAELEDKIESRQAVILPTGAIDVLKLLTCASICYQHIYENMVERMAKSEDIGKLFMKSPMPQGTMLRTALYELMQSDIDCNKITGIDDVLKAMPSFKKYIEKAEAKEKLKELRGEK